MHLFLLVGGIAVVAAVTVALAVSPRWRRSAPRTSRLLVLAAVVAAVGTDLAVLPMLIADRAGPTGIAVTLVPPVVLTLLGAAALLLRPAVAATLVIWTATALMFAFVVVYGLGVGLLYTPTAVLLLAGAIARTTGQTQARSGVPAGS